MMNINNSSLRMLRKRTSEKQSMRQDREKKKYHTFFLLFIFGLLFFAASLLLYTFQGSIPHISWDSKTLVSPNSISSKDTDFRQALHKYNIQFESLEYATQSPTLVVKLPQDAYAYLNTSTSAVSQAFLLSNILKKLSIEKKDEKLKYIDLRFGKAIIKF